MTEPSEYSIYRALDAAINRAGEGLRVVEDYLRMVLGDAHLSRSLKQLRHDLTAAARPIGSEKRIGSRDSESDVGRHVALNSEYDRGATNPAGEANPQSDSIAATNLVQANLARAQQAIRSIEEFSKTIDVDLAKSIEQLRYQAYTIEKAVVTTLLSLRRLDQANLCVLIRVDEDDLELAAIGERVQVLIDAGVDLVQLRDKQLDDRSRIKVGREIARRVKNSSTRFIMNDRADLALACGADGVHLGQEDLPIADARRILGASRIIGVSTHSIQQAQQAVVDGANYIGVGPVFESRTKSFDSLAGLELVRDVAAEIQLPAFAIGGIDPQNVDQVIQAGATRVAVGAAVTEAADPAEVVYRLKSKMKN